MLLSIEHTLYTCIVLTKVGFNVRLLEETNLIIKHNADVVRTKWSGGG